MCVCVCVNVLIMSSVHEIYSNIISLENLFKAWNEFKKGKRNRKDVQFFESVDHNTLINLIAKKIQDKDLLLLIKNILKSFSADDFVILSTNQEHLRQLISRIAAFLKTNLALSLHENKIVLRKYVQGIDFLGYIVLPHYILPRTKTRRRIFKKLKEKVQEENFNQSLQSYLGYLKHASSYKLSQQIKNEFYLGA